MAGRRSVADARDTRALILRRAADLASIEGLEGLTIGRLAADLDMSKAGVIGHFGSKEELQLATLDLASEIFRQKVWDPVEHEQPGLSRLLAITRSWTDYIRNPAFAGGCFIAMTSFEFSGRDGRVYDELARVTRRWRRTLEREVEQAVENGELPEGTDPRQVAFGLEALASGAGSASGLQGDTDAADMSLASMRSVIGLPAVGALA